MARRSSRCEHLRMHCGPASGVAGDWGGELAGGRAQRAALPVRSSSGRRSRAARRSQSPRSPGTGGPLPAVAQPIQQSSRYAPCMDSLVVALVSLVVLVLLAIWWRARAHRGRHALPEARRVTGKKPQFETTMNELREMRQALRPSEAARPFSNRSS